MTVMRLGPLQVCGLEIYVADCAHKEPESREVAAMFDPAEMTLAIPPGRELTALDVVIEAGNSADCDNDRPVVRALEALQTRLVRAAKLAGF